MVWQNQSLWRQGRDKARSTFKLGCRPSELPRKRTMQKNVPGIAWATAQRCEHVVNCFC